MVNVQKLGKFLIKNVIHKTSVDLIDAKWLTSSTANFTTKLREQWQMLLLLRRRLMDVTTFCAFEKIRESSTAEKEAREYRSVCDRKE